jgi:hypothetical protein
VSWVCLGSLPLRAHPSSPQATLADSFLEDLEELEAEGDVEEEEEDEAVDEMGVDEEVGGEGEVDFGALFASTAPDGVRGGTHLRKKPDYVDSLEVSE